MTTDGFTTRSTINEDGSRAERAMSAENTALSTQRSRQRFALGDGASEWQTQASPDHSRLAFATRLLHRQRDRRVIDRRMIRANSGIERRNMSSRRSWRAPREIFSGSQQVIRHSYQGISGSTWIAGSKCRLPAANHAQKWVGRLSPASSTLKPTVSGSITRVIAPV